MDKTKKIDILHIENEITKFIEVLNINGMCQSCKDWKATNKTGTLLIEIGFYKGGIRNVDVNENNKFKIK